MMESQAFNLLIGIIACGCFGAVFAVFWGFPMKVARFFKRSRLRPFTCEKCMGFHAGWVWMHYFTGMDWPHSIFMAFIPAVIAIYIIRYAN